jgi:hypothetical protein
MLSNNLLSLAIWVPIAAGVLVLATGSDSRAALARIVAFVGALAGFLVHHVMVVLAGWQVIQKRTAQYMGAFLILSGLMVTVCFRARRPAVLRVLRSHADPDVHHHRHLGRPAPRLCGVQVLPLHAARLAADAGGADLPVLSSPAAASTSWPGTSCRCRCRAELLFFAFFAAFCGEGADVAGAHLAARCPRRSAHRRLGGAGGHHAEAGRLRLPALLAADRARCQHASYAGSSSR